VSETFPKEAFYFVWGQVGEAPLNDLTYMIPVQSDHDVYDTPSGEPQRMYLIQRLGHNGPPGV
jgi:hypothetical protein